jgi:signal transduction histidine kinase
MAAMVAHEFNNILTPMISYADLAESGDERMRDKAVRRAAEGSHRATRICQALLSVARAEEQAPAERVALADVVEETLAAMARDLSKDGIRLIREVPASLEVVTRPVELKQVLLNLLLNARWAAMQRGSGQSIRISAARSGDQVRLRVSDTGIGIPRENLQRIFEAFFTTKGKEGSGLGLAFCREVVEELGGRLTVRSQEGKGSCFTVALPLAPAEASSGNDPRRRERCPAGQAG